MAVTEMFGAVNWPHESLKDSHQDGATEPWVAEAACALLKAKGGTPSVLETGSFIGTTSAWLALTLQKMGGGTFVAAEIDAVRAEAVRSRLASLDLSRVNWTVAHDDVMTVIANLQSRSLDFVWLDDDHQKHHVEQEIVALWPKLSRGGIICFHDIDEPCNLGDVVKKYGGVALRFPKLGPAGGLGILQVP